MRIQRSRRGRVAASSAGRYKHFVLIPKRLADGAGIMSGTILHVSPPAAGARPCLLHKLPGPGRTPVTVTEQVTKRVGDEAYTSLKFVIPAGLVRDLSLEPGDDAEMSAVPGVGLAVRFGRGRSGAPHAPHLQTPVPLGAAACRSRTDAPHRSHTSPADS